MWDHHNRPICISTTIIANRRWWWQLAVLLHLQTKEQILRQLWCWRWWLLSWWSHGFKNQTKHRTVFKKISNSTSVFAQFFGFWPVLGVLTRPNWLPVLSWTSWTDQSSSVFKTMGGAVALRDAINEGGLDERHLRWPSPPPPLLNSDYRTIIWTWSHRKLVEVSDFLLYTCLR